MADLRGLARDVHQQSIGSIIRSWVYPAADLRIVLWTTIFKRRRKESMGNGTRYTVVEGRKHHHIEHANEQTMFEASDKRGVLLVTLFVTLDDHY